MDALLSHAGTLGRILALLESFDNEDSAGCDTLIGELFRLMEDLGIPTKLSAIGIEKGDLPAVAETAAGNSGQEGLKAPAQTPAIDGVRRIFLYGIDSDSSSINLSQLVSSELLPDEINRNSDLETNECSSGSLVYRIP